MSRNNNSFNVNFLGSAYSLFMHTYNFAPCHMTAQTLRLYGFTEIIKFIAYIKKLLCKNCLYADYS